MFINHSKNYQSELQHKHLLPAHTQFNSNKLNGRTPMGQKKGPPTKLSPELDNCIEKWIIHMARIGYGQTRTDILDKVEELLNKLNVKKMFGDSNRPSIKWYTLFMARHPNL